MYTTIKSVIFGLVMFTMLNANAQPLQPGASAPPFHLKNVDGTMVSLDDFADQKGVVLIFTCNHCPFAIAWEDRIIALDKKYKELGYPVVAINPNDPEIQPQDSFEEMVKRANSKEFGFPYLFDESQDVYRSYGATHTPHVFLLHKANGIFEIRYVGAIDDNYKDATAVKSPYLESAINALLEGYPVDPQETKALGCSIKKK
jgi:peroxiredoxin